MGSLLFKNILDWMQINNLRLCSFERIVSSVPGASNYEEVATVVRENLNVFRPANIKNIGPGLALVDSFRFPDITPNAPIQVQDLTEQNPGIPMPANTECNTTPVATAVVETHDFTPREAVVKLLNLAATADVSGTALNYANAAVAAATAVQLLQDAD